MNVLPSGCVDYVYVGDRTLFRTLGDPTTGGQLDLSDFDCIGIIDLSFVDIRYKNIVRLGDQPQAIGINGLAGTQSLQVGSFGAEFKPQCSSLLKLESGCECVNLAKCTRLVAFESACSGDLALTLGDAPLITMSVYGAKLITVTGACASLRHVDLQSPDKSKVVFCDRPCGEVSFSNLLSLSMHNVRPAACLDLTACDELEELHITQSADRSDVEAPIVLKMAPFPPMVAMTAEHVMMVSVFNVVRTMVRLHITGYARIINLDNADSLKSLFIDCACAVSLSALSHTARPKWLQYLTVKAHGHSYLDLSACTALKLVDVATGLVGLKGTEKLVLRTGGDIPAPLLHDVTVIELYNTNIIGDFDMTHCVSLHLVDCAFDPLIITGTLIETVEIVGCGATDVFGQGGATNTILAVLGAPRLRSVRLISGFAAVPAFANTPSLELVELANSSVTGVLDLSNAGVEVSTRLHNTPNITLYA